MAHSVLLIEARAGSCAGIRPVLEELGLEVTAVDSCPGSHALLAACEGFHLALVDCHVHEPGAGACDVPCEHLRDSRLPFAVLSERSDRALVQASIEAGALCYVPKAAGPEFIAPVIASAVARAAERRELTATVSRLSEAMKAKRPMHIATGILMERFRLNDSDAARLLRYFARSHRITLDDASEKVMSKAGSLEMLAAANRFAQRFAP